MKLMLDLGCGSGASMKRYKKKGFKTVGIDIEIESHSYSILKAKKYGFILLSDARQLPFKDNIFDLISARYVLHHIPNGLNVIEEIKRCLKKDGLLELLESTENNTLLKYARKIHHFFFKYLQNFQGEDVLCHFTYEDILEQLKKNNLKIVHYRRDKLFSFLPFLNNKFFRNLDNFIITFIGKNSCARCRLLIKKI